MTKYSKRFPDLDNFLSAYFNPDWKSCYDWQGEKPNYEAVVRFYTWSNLPDEVAQTIKELETFLALPLSDQKIQEIVDDHFHAWYTPPGMTKRQWLEAMLLLLKEPPRHSNLSFMKP